MPATVRAFSCGWQVHFQSLLSFALDLLTHIQLALLFSLSKPHATRSLSSSVNGKSVPPAAVAKNLDKPPPPPPFLSRPMFGLSGKHVGFSFQIDFLKNRTARHHPHCCHLAPSHSHQPCALELVQLPPEGSAGPPSVLFK